MDIKKIIAGVMSAKKVAEFFGSMFGRKGETVVQNVYDELAPVQSFAVTIGVVAETWKDKNISNEDKTRAIAPLAAQSLHAVYANRNKKLRDGQEAELLRLSGAYGSLLYDIDRLFEDK